MTSVWLFPQFFEFVFFLFLFFFSLFFFFFFFFSIFSSFSFPFSFFLLLLFSFFLFFYVFFPFSLFFFSLSFYFFNSQSTNGTRSFFRHDSRRSCFNERGADTPWQTETSKHVRRLDTMQYAVRVEQRTAVCQSMCSKQMLSTTATTRMFTVLLSGRFRLQSLLGSGRRRCSLTRAPLTRLN